MGKLRLGLALAVLLAACETPAPAATDPPSPRSSSEPSPTAPEELKVAFVEDLSAEEALDRTLPALHALELAFATAASSGREPVQVEVVELDTNGDPSAAQQIAAETAVDPSFVAAVAAPDVGGIQALADGLGDVPLLSLSPRGSVDGAAPGTWFRFVAPLTVQASALADGVARLARSDRGVCLVAAPSDPTRFSRTVRRELSARLRVVEAAGASDVAATDCGVVVWTGGALGGADLAVELERAAPDAVLVGGAALREPDFLREAETAAEGAVSFCSCADVSTSLELAARRFIQDFQSEYANAPGPYAVEAWDAAHLLVNALREGGRSREAVTGSLAGSRSFEGLGGLYGFVGGELANPETAIHPYRMEGGRWISVEAPGAVNR